MEDITKNGRLNDIEGNYELYDENDKRKVEEIVVRYMHDYKKTPSEFYGTTPKDLYKLVDRRWRMALKLNKEMMERELMEITSKLSKEDIDIVSDLVDKTLISKQEL